MIEYTTVTRPTTAIRAPGTSSFGASESADSGTTFRVPAMAMTASTTLRAKTERQSQNSSSVPEATTPSTALAPATPAQMLTALVRSVAAKVPVIVDRVAGITSAAPTPSRARSAISSCAPLAVIATAEATVKIPSPASSIRRRPNRSPRAPAGRRSEAKSRE